MQSRSYLGETIAILFCAQRMPQTRQHLRATNRPRVIFFLVQVFLVQVGATKIIYVRGRVCDQGLPVTPSQRKSSLDRKTIPRPLITPMHAIPAAADAIS